MSPQAASPAASSAPTPSPASMPSFGLRFLIRVLVVLFFLGVGVDHRDRKQQQRHEQKRQEQRQQEQLQQHAELDDSALNATTTQALVSNATAATNATTLPRGNDLLDDSAVSSPLESPWLPTLGGLLLNKLIDWQLFDPRAPSLQEWAAYLSNSFAALHWPEAETALAGTAMVTGGAYVAYQEKMRLDSLEGCWAHLHATWWAQGFLAANAARHGGPCESPRPPAPAPAPGGEDPQAHDQERTKLVSPSGHNEPKPSSPSGHDDPEPSSMASFNDPAWHHRFRCTFWWLLGRGWSLLGRGGYYHGAALKFLAKAWLPPSIQGRLGQMEVKLDVRLADVRQTFVGWTLRTLLTGTVPLPFVDLMKPKAKTFLEGIEGVCMTIRSYARSWFIVQQVDGEAGWCGKVKLVVFRVCRMYIGPSNVYFWMLIAVAAGWCMVSAWHPMAFKRQTQQATEGTDMLTRGTRVEGRPAGGGRMNILNVARRSAEADRAKEEGRAAAVARAQEEERERQRQQDQETLLGKRQHALFKILRTVAAQRRAADASVLVDAYTRSWQLLRRLYALERDMSKPWSVREKELKQMWPIFDAHWEALEDWSDGCIPRELPLSSSDLGGGGGGDSSIEGAQVARTYARLARAVASKTNDFMCPRPTATPHDVKQKTQWRECADLAALRPQVLARYWRECGFARQQMWKRAVWAVLMSHQDIRASVTPRMQNWAPRLRRKQLEHQQVPLWRGTDSGQPDVQLLHTIELRPLDLKGAVPETTRDRQVTLFSVDLGRGGMMCPNKRPHLLQGWLDGPMEAKLAMAAMVPIRAVETRRLLELEPAIEIGERKLRARLRALVLPFVTSQEMGTLETAVAGTTAITTSTTGHWTRVLLSRRAIPSAVALEHARRRHAGEGAVEHKQRETGAGTPPVPWPNILEVRLDLHRRPPSSDTITLHSHLAAILMVRKKYPSEANKAAEGTGGKGARTVGLVPGTVKTTEVEGGGHWQGSAAAEGMRKSVKERGAGGGAKETAPTLVPRASPTLPVAALDTAAARAPQPKPASMLPRPPPPSLPHLRCATGSTPSVVPHQQTVRPRRRTRWFHAPPRGRGVLAGLRYFLFHVAMYGIPAYVFTVWAWYLYTQWVEKILAQERAMAAAAAGAETPTVDDVIRSLPAMGGIKVSKMGWNTAEWPLDEEE